MERIDSTTLNELILTSLGEIIKNPGRWTDFIRSRTCRNYGLRFDQIYSIYMFDPDADACATYEAWQNCGRPVRHGSRGLPVLSQSGGLKYYFPKKVTSETEKATPLFELGKQHIGFLGNHYQIANADYESLYAKIHDELNDNLIEEQQTHGSDWNSLTQSANSEDISDFVIRSAAFIVMTSLETDPDTVKISPDFELIRKFEPTQLIIAGNIAMNCARQYLLTVKKIIKEEMTRKYENSRHQLESRGRYPDTDDKLEREHGGVRVVRTEEERIPEEQSAGNVRGVDDSRQSGGTLPGDRSGRGKDGGRDHRTDKDESRNLGEAERKKSDGIRGEHEPDKEPSPGDGPERAGIPGNEITDELIDEILMTGSDEIDSYDRIISRLILGLSDDRMTTFLQREYLGRGGTKKGFQIDGQKISVIADEQGIHLSAGRSALTENAVTIKYYEAAQRIKLMYKEARFGAYSKFEEFEQAYNKMLRETASNIYFYLTDYHRGDPLLNNSVTGDNAIKQIEKEITNEQSLHEIIQRFKTYQPGSQGRSEQMINAIQENLINLDGTIDIILQENGSDLLLPSFITDDEISDILRTKASEDRISTFYLTNTNKKQRADLLKNEYGVGGHTIRSGLVSYDAKGIMIKRHGKNYTDGPGRLLSWKEAAERIAEILQPTQTLTENRPGNEPDTDNTQISLSDLYDMNPIKKEEEEDNNRDRIDAPDLEPDTAEILAEKEGGPESPEITQVVNGENPENREYIEAGNYHIENFPEQSIGSKYLNNVKAIKVLKQLEEEDRQATFDEQKTLAGYTGWGGLPSVFDPSDARYDELKDLFTESEYEAARESTLTSFYTDPIIIDSIYMALSQMGFKSGTILEPSCGVGNFFGRLPENMVENTKLFGVELDSISGRIAKKLYPESQIQITGFENAVIPDNYFDIALGNVPFGQFKVRDRQYDRNNWMIHDYFFGKTLDKVRSGGIIAFITSKGTMDKENSSLRRYVAERAEFLGAIRLPDNAFKGAGTKVTSDIIFLKKRDKIIENPEDTWLSKAVNRDGIEINRYFAEHPEMCLGDIVMQSIAYGQDSTCRARNGDDLGTQLRSAIKNVKGDYLPIIDRSVQDQETQEEWIPADPNVRNYSYAVIDDKLYFRIDNVMYPPKKNSKAQERIRGLIKIRELTRKLIDLQLKDGSDDEITETQAALNSEYDSFVDKYGRINSRGNAQAFSDDESYYLLCSLEILDNEQKFSRKADIFDKRTIKRHVPVLNASTSSDALSISLSEKGRVDLDYMSSISGIDREQIINDLKGIIFRNISPNDGHSYVSAEEYLSGNVRQKLAWAVKAKEIGAKDAEINIQALKKVQPKDLAATEISARLGSTWIPEEVIEDFINELISYKQPYHDYVKYIPLTGQWRIKHKSSVSYLDVKANQTYGTKEKNALYILEDTLNLKDTKVTFYNYQTQRSEVDVKATKIARARQDLIKQTFKDWLWKDPDRRNMLVGIYNEKFNSIRPRTYDGSYLRFDGINNELMLATHQVNAIARVIGGGNTLLAHCVGAGKTFEMVAAAQEMKRLGLMRKALFVVPNHLTEQWGAEYLRLYPGANILVATKKDFETKNRKKFCSRIATGEYDAVIIGHSQFDKIPMSSENQIKYYQEQLDELIDAAAAAKVSGDGLTVKALEATKKRLKARLDKLNDQKRKDDVITFEELGIDRLFIDEAHYFKNLATFTKMRNVAGINNTEALKSQDLYMKCRYLDEITGNRGIIFATGTPISNSMTEMYTMQKYLQYSLLKSMDLLNFDSWATTFGETRSETELSPTGNGFRVKTRFNRFYNLPELTSIFREIADVQTPEMLNLPVPNCERHTVVLEASEIQQEIVDTLSERADAVHSRIVDPTIDNMLKITNDGRKLALDQRLYDPELPENPNGKTSACAQEVYRIWEKTNDEQLTQLVFCDLSTPGSDHKWNVYEDLKAKLVNMGMPENEIAFIHDAKTDLQKESMFASVREGKIRVLMGSTSKMGAGTNCQTRLIALHHLDCPWRPSDLQQQEGRILRRGNMNDTVHIFNYVTKGTFDAYMYQLVEQKQKFIGQIMTSKQPARIADDVDAAALNYAEIKSCCTGNPLIKEKMDLDIELQQLTLLKNTHYSQQFDLEDMVNIHIPVKIKSTQDHIDTLRNDILSVVSSDQKSESFTIRLNNENYSEKEDAGKTIQILAEAVLQKKDKAYIGLYRGLKIAVTKVYDVFTSSYSHQIVLEGAGSYAIKLPRHAYKATVEKLDNLIDGLKGEMESSSERLKYLQTQLENAKKEIGKPFPEEERLKYVQKRLSEVNAELELDKSEDLLEIEESETEIEETEVKAKNRKIS